MKRISSILIGMVCLATFLPAQVPLEEITEDKSELADNYYGTFKYKGKVYSGQAIAYHANGKIKTLRNFKDGKYHGWWTEWYTNGNRKFQGDRKKNKGHGPTRWWYENGQLKKQGTYNMDWQEGVVVWWHPNGALKQIRHYKNDKAFGGWTTFDESGAVYDEGDDEHLYYRSFFPEPAGPGVEEASPSFTADGKTMVFARHIDWTNKVPYIAHYVDNSWIKEQLTFTDTLYNLAIAPDGNRIIFKQYAIENGEEISRTFVVEKQKAQWGEPKEVKTLYNINAGYFNILPDGTLYLFARKPKTGIFYAKPDPKSIYSTPQWLSDELSPEKSTAFDVLVHPDQNKLIVTISDIPKEWRSGFGEAGFHYFEKEGGAWKHKRRLPLAYGWGASITPDGTFVYVRNDGIKYVSLKDLILEW